MDSSATPSVPLQDEREDRKARFESLLPPVRVRPIVKELVPLCIHTNLIPKLFQPITWRERGELSVLDSTRGMVLLERKIDAGGITCILSVRRSLQSGRKERALFFFLRFLLRAEYGGAGWIGESVGVLWLDVLLSPSSPKPFSPKTNRPPSWLKAKE